MLSDGRHALQIRARKGNTWDTLPVVRTWIIDTTAPTTPAAVSVPAATAPPAAKAPFAVTFRYRKGKLTKLAVTGVPAGAKLDVTVKRPHQRATKTTIAKLVGRRLPQGTTITVRAGALVKTIRLS